MTVLEANLRNLARGFPDLERLLRALPPVPDRGEWTLARSGDPVVRRGGVAWASAFDPRLEASRAVPQDQDSDFFLLPGLGVGYLAEAVTARYPGVPVVVAESDPLWFREVLAHRDMGSLWACPSLVVLLGPDPVVVGAFLERWACRTVRTLVWRPQYEQEGPWHRAVEAEVAAAQARSRVNVATFQRFGGLWARNLRRNEAAAPEVRPVSSLANRWSGVPAVIAAAGPSLADAFDWMTSHRDRYVLIAVDTAWPALAARGFVPDVLLVLDGQYANSRHVDTPPPPPTVVVTEWTAPPRAFRLAQGRTFVAESSVSVLRRREQAVWGALGSLPSGGSVATAAWSLARLLGCSEVAFAGLDLGYPRGETHVAGSQFEEAVHRVSGRLRPAETGGLRLRGLDGLVQRPSVDGSVVLSDARMDLFRHWLSAAVQARPEIRAVNLGTRGSIVPGLVSAPPDYGDHWPSRRDPPWTPCAPLKRGEIPPLPPPFRAFEAVAGARDFPAAVENAWAAAREYWGDVWDRWAGRAYETWVRFPSDRSRLAVEETVAVALTWREFWRGA